MCFYRTLLYYIDTITVSDYVYEEQSKWESDSIKNRKSVNW